MHAVGNRELAVFRLQLWTNADEKRFGMLPLPVFFPDPDIKQLLDCFSLIATVEDLTSLLHHNKYLSDDFHSLFVVVCNLRKEFDAIRLANKEKVRVARLAKKAIKNVEQDCIDDSGVEGEASEVTDETDNDSDSDQPGHRDGPSGIKLRIDLRSLTAVRVDNQSAEASSCNDRESEGLAQPLAPISSLNMPVAEA